MGVEIKTKGLVLHEMPIGDYDKRLILLTKELGKITAFAKGAKKSNSKLLAGCQIFSYSDFILYKGTSNYNVNSVSLIEPYHRLRNSMDALTYGLYILEFSEYISIENTHDHDLMRLILKTLKLLELGQKDLELTVKIFELKAMSYLGYSPLLDYCVACNRVDDLTYFSTVRGGLICSHCGVQHNNLLKISNGTIYTMKYILSQSIDKLFLFELENSIFNEFKLVMHQFIEYNLNKKFKSLEFLKLQY